MRSLDYLSGDVSMHDSINCNPAVPGETSNELSLLWGASRVHQTTATQ